MSIAAPVVIQTARSGAVALEENPTLLTGVNIGAAVPGTITGSILFAGLALIIAGIIVLIIRIINPCFLRDVPGGPITDCGGYTGISGGRLFGIFLIIFGIAMLIGVPLIAYLNYRVNAAIFGVVRSVLISTKSE